MRVGHFENGETKANRQQNREKRKEGEETSEKCEELEGKGQVGERRVI